MPGRDSYPILVNNYIRYVNHIHSFRTGGYIDLEYEKWLTPSEILLLKSIISEARREGRYKPPRDEKVKGYLDYITSESSDQNSIGPGYIRLSRVDADNADSIASKITSMIGNKLKKESLNVLRYCINELLTNVVEHSQYKNSFIVLQNYPSQRRLEFALIDDGISIPGNFKIHHIDFRDDSDSLNKAISGVSTKAEDGGRGWGLSSVFRVLTMGMQGEGVIASGRGILSSNFVKGQGDKLPTKLFCYADNSEDFTIFKGCFIAFKVRNDLSPDLYEFL